MGNYIFSYIFDFMSENPKSLSYTFKYDGEFKSLDALTVLHTQLNFVTIVSEIKDHKYPELKLDFKIKGLTKGSLDVHHVVEVAAISGMFVIQNYEYITNVFKIFSDLISIKKFLKGKKADSEKELPNGKIVIEFNGDNITVEKDAIKIYQQSPIITNSLVNTGKLLSENEDIDFIEVSENKSNKKLLVINKGEFESLKEDNPYLERAVDEQVYHQQHLYIKKPNLFPEKKKKWVWELLHRGRDIKAVISDDSLRSRVNSGLKVGQGDRLVADLKIYYKFDERFNTFVESGKYEVKNVIDVVSRPENGKFDYEN